jgi:hypothetical protein
MLEIRATQKGYIELIISIFNFLQKSYPKSQAQNLLRLKDMLKLKPHREFFIKYFNCIICYFFQKLIFFSSENVI